MDQITFSETECQTKNPKTRRNIFPNLSDPMVENVLYEIEAMELYAGFKLAAARLNRNN